jgi:hypothetical protein
LTAGRQEEGLLWVDFMNDYRMFLITLGVEPFNEGDGDAESEPQINSQEFYCLSEAGEGAMAWEGTLQSLFPGCRAFWNRLLSDAKTKLSPKVLIPMLRLHFLQCQKSCTNTK